MIGTIVNITQVEAPDFENDYQVEIRSIHFPATGPEIYVTRVDEPYMHHGYKMESLNHWVDFESGWRVKATEV